MTIQVNTPTVSSGGERTDSWATLETVYAAIEPMSAYESLRASQPGMTATHRFTMRYRTDLGVGNIPISPKHRLYYNSVAYDIVSVRNPGEQHRWTEVDARRIA